MEMDAISATKQCTGICVLAATNMPFALDSALLTPGRFDVAIEVGLPDMKDRVCITFKCFF